MNLVATAPDEERADLFRRTAERMNLAAALAEKDFWVCWALGQLFENRSLRDVMMFKGGTALAKAFKLLQRFSEDIDLAIDYAPLGFTGDRDPRVEMSRTRREKLLDEMMGACRAFIAGPIVEELRGAFKHALGRASGWSLSLDRNDPNTIEFAYPLAGVDGVGFVRPAVRLELGTHAELVPSGDYEVTPYAAEQFPEIFRTASAHVRAIKPERTFWEKATILHVEHHRPQSKAFPSRHARHYYDMAMLARSPVRDVAIADLDLLRRVVEHKTKFYYAGWAKYDLAVPGTLKLLPTSARREELRRDYDAMAVMLFGPAPPLVELLEELSGLEAQINGHA